MTSVRKVQSVGSSRGITLPAKWLTLQERLKGSKIIEVLVTENANSIIIVPVIPQKTEQETAPK